MSLQKKFLTLAAPVALLALGGCAAGLPTQVSRFQAMPAPQGQTFVIQAADEQKRGGLEFAQYADLVRRHLIAQGYSEAPSAEQASFVVELDYGVDNGREQVVARPDPFARYGWGYGFGYRPVYSRFGYYGHPRHPFFYGWHDPFFSPFGGGYDIDTYTVFTSFLDMNIRRTADGQALFEGIAQARSTTNALPALVPNLVEAMFTGFPGNSGETVRITVPSPRQR
ncbi:MAG: DUF4136 domain-containing protein [Allosphingosinicella sp.]|uniref:DUF4136 domain-containing protein n=1 Tax=Allosphingosinicella sp. TaxID=2823234 RepID=UPI0039405AE4